MPSKSKAQARLMQAVAHNPEFAEKLGIPQSVGKEFFEADKKRKKFRNNTQPEQQKVNRKETNHGHSALFSEGGGIMAKESEKAMEMRHARTLRKLASEEEAEAREEGMACGGRVKKRMAAGGSVGRGDGCAKRGRTKGKHC